MMYHERSDKEVLGLKLKANNPILSLTAMLEEEEEQEVEEEEVGEEEETQEEANQKMKNRQLGREGRGAETDCRVVWDGKGW